MKKTIFVLAAVLAAWAFAGLAEARNVDLATVPARESVQLTI